MTRFTKRTYRKARNRAINEMYSHLDGMEYANQKNDPILWDAEFKAYFKHRTLAERIVARGRLEEGLWPR